MYIFIELDLINYRVMSYKRVFEHAVFTHDFSKLEVRIFRDRTLMAYFQYSHFSGFSGAPGLEVNNFRLNDQELLYEVRRFLMAASSFFLSAVPFEDLNDSSRYIF